jgi:hypothetical protein
LASLQKEFGLYTGGDKALEETMMSGGGGVSTLEFESNVMDNPAVNSRAGLYIYVNSLVSKDDLSFLLLFVFVADFSCPACWAPITR